MLEYLKKKLNYPKKGFYTRDSTRIYITKSHTMKFKTTAKFKEWWLENVQSYPQCQICQRTDASFYDCDHIMSKGRHPNHPELWNRLNLILVCRQCHTKKNLIKDKYEQIIQERCLRELFK